jgi:hypothetical protein
MFIGTALSSKNVCQTEMSAVRVSCIEKPLFEESNECVRIDDLFLINDIDLIAIQYFGSTASVNVSYSVLVIYQFDV